MGPIASFSVKPWKRTMPKDSQTPETYIYQVSRELKKKISRELAAILIIDEKENLIRSSISVYILMGDFT